MRELTYEEMEQVDGGHQSGGLPVAGMGFTLDSATGSYGGIAAAATGLGGGMSSAGMLGTALLANGWINRFGWASAS